MRAVTDKVLIQNIERHRAVVVAVCCALKPALLVGFQAILTLQTGHAVTTNHQAIFTEFNMHARVAIGSVRHRKLASHMGKQDHIIFLALTGCPVLPGIKTARANLHYGTHLFGWHDGLVRINELEPRRLGSLAKKTAAS